MANYPSINSQLREFSRPISNLTVEKDGDWKKLDSLFQYLVGTAINRGIKRDIAKAQRDFLTKMKKTLVKGLSTGGAAINTPFEPHSSNYKQSSGIVGVKSGNYLKALQGAEIKAKGYIVSLNLSRAAVAYKRKNSNMTLGQYAYAFEVGTKRQPPRPLWAGSYSYLGGDTGVLNNMLGAVGKRLSKIGVRVRHRGYQYLR